MTSRTKSKAASVVLNILSFAFMLALPFWAITEKFPIWKEEGGIFSALGGGVIIMAVIAFFTFKKYIVAFATEKLGAISAGTSLLVLWSGLSAVCVALAKSATLLDDLTTIFVWSAVGAAVGVVLQLIAKYIKWRTTNGNSER